MTEYSDPAAGGTYKDDSHIAACGSGHGGRISILPVATVGGPAFSTRRMYVLYGVHVL